MSDEPADESADEPAPSDHDDRAGRPLLGLLVFLGFLAVTVVLYGAPLLDRMSTGCIGRCVPDTSLYIWSMRWMAYAIGHGADPLFSELVWAPDGANLTWVTSLPGPAFVMSPVTSLFGPVVSVNVWMLLAPALAGWSAFALLREVTARTAPSIAGAAVFGYSTYVAQHMRSHLNLLLVFLVPLAAYLVVRRVRGRIGPVAFVVLLSLVLIGQFSVSTEIFATMSMFGGFALAGVIAFGGSELRPRIVRTLPLIAVAFVVTAVVVSPFLVKALDERPEGQLRPGERNSADLLSFVLPRRPMLIGGKAFAAETRDFPAKPWDDTAYVSVGLLVVLALFVWERRRERSTWLLLAFISTAAVLSLGPVLHVDGEPTIPLPGRALEAIPLLQHALPERFPMYLFLALAIVAALWSASGSSRWGPVRYAVLAVCVILMLPSQILPGRQTDLRVPAFFHDGTYRSLLQSGENVLVIPTRLGRDLVFQAEADMSFRLARTYLGPVRPEGLAQLRPVLSSGDDLPGPATLRRFLEDREVGAVIVEEPAGAPLVAWLEDVLGTPGTIEDGVRVYQVPETLPP